MAREAVGVPELFERARKLYLARYRLHADAYRNRRDVTVCVERMWREQDGSPTRFGTLAVPKRFDIFVAAPHRATAIGVDHELIVKFEPFEIEHADERGTLRVLVRPFQWHACLVTFPPESRLAAKNWEGLRLWYEDWFGLDLDGTEVRDDDWAFGGAVHFLSDPQPSEEGVTFEIDLGSALIDAVLSLLDVALEHGVTRVVIGAR